MRWLRMLKRGDSSGRNSSRKLAAVARAAKELGVTEVVSGELAWAIIKFYIFNSYKTMPIMPKGQKNKTNGGKDTCLNEADTRSCQQRRTPPHVPGPPGVPHASYPAQRRTGVALA
jgi:hypothetical protein